MVEGSSEEHFESVVSGLAGPTCFWLDGHYSGQGTYRAAIETPISHELSVIERNLARLSPLVVLVDDFREFPSVSSKSALADYPTREFLVEWSQRNGLDWSVEHDIFLAGTPGRRAR
jgi:hypothetical protein